MKILAYSSYYKPYTSGMTVYLERLMNHLKKRSHITLLTFKHSKSLPSFEGGEIKIVRMPFLFRVSKGFASPQSLSYYWNHVKKNDAVLINIPNAEAFFLALFAKLLKKKLIVIYHCDIDLGEGLFNAVITAILNFSVGFQLMVADSIIACPDYIEHRSFYLKYKHKIIETIPPVEYVKADPVFLKKTLAEKGEMKRVGFVGRIAREKGIEYAIEAMKLINNSDYEFVIIGPGKKHTVGEEKYYEAAIKFLEDSNVSYRIYNSPSDTELAALYETLSVLVLPSFKKTEAFGMVQAEAMLHGSPVVSSELPGIRLPVKLTGCGMTAEAKNAEKFAERIYDVLHKKYDRAMVMKKAQKVFDAQTTYECFDDLLFGDK